MKGDGETIYYVKEGKGKGGIGANKATCTDLILFLKDNEVQKIKFIKKPTATLYPMKDVIGSEFLLEKFSWKIIQRPKQKNEVFIHN